MKWGAAPHISVQSAVLVITEMAREMITHYYTR
jgi:hypothetical protein